MSPEFELLDIYFKKMYLDEGVSRELLRKVLTHIEMCRNIAETESEKAKIRVAEFWWDRQARQFGMDKYNASEDKITEHDRRFLRALFIKFDDK